MTKKLKKEVKIYKPELILIDFDGVISKNSVLLNIKSAYEFINKYLPLPYETILSFIKNTICFSVEQTIDFLFKSLGIEDKISEFHREQLKFYNNPLIKIEEDFYGLLDYCEKNSIQYLVYSSANNGVKKIPEFIKRIGKDKIYNLNGRSKANFRTYLELAEELKIDLNKCLYIDDTPLALRTGKLHGMTTVMMINDVFTIEDYRVYSLYIDHKINSFVELLNVLFLQN